MSGLEIWNAAIALVALIAYCLTGGADFGGGLWDLLARGPRREGQRRLIAQAIAPIWEANHVWLVAVIVILFVGFPKAFAVLGIGLHVPLAIMLLGIVWRGSAFAFRAYDSTGPRARRWARVFAVASTVTPVMLGVCLAAVANGRLAVAPYTGHAATDFIDAWWTPFPWAIGLFTLGLFAFLAAVYLTVDADGRQGSETELQDDFRRRSIYSGVVVGVLAWTCLLLAASGAPYLHEGLTGRPWSVPFHLGTGAVAVGCLAALWRRRFRLARALAAAQVTLVVLGWALSQYPYVIVDTLDVTSAAAPAEVQGPLLAALLVVLALVLPAYGYLMHVFKLSSPRSLRSAEPLQKSEWVES